MASPSGDGHKAGTGTGAASPLQPMTGGGSVRVKVAARLSSLASESLAMASAGAFLMLATALSFVPDARRDRVDTWQLRGAIAEPAPPAFQTHAQGGSGSPARDPAVPS